MKFKYMFVAGAFTLFCGSLQALDPSAPKAEQFQNQQSTAEVIGIEVRNLQDEKLGRVKFITADLENGRLVEVVISAGGFLGFGGKLTSAPPRAFTMDARRQLLRLDVSKARFDAAPRFNAPDLAAYSHPGRVAAVLRYFGLQPWFYVDGQAVSKNSGTLRLGTVRKTQDILDLPIRSKTGQYLGQVGSMLFDVTKGQIIHVVDETPSMGNSGSYIIRPQALRYNAARNGLVLNETFQMLKNEPHFKWMAGTRQSYEEERPANSKVPAGRKLPAR